MLKFSALDQKTQNLMREGGKKKTKKKHRTIFRKVYHDNEGDEIKKTLDQFLEKWIKATK